MHDGREVGPGGVDGLVKRQFRRGPVQSLLRTIRADADDVFPPQSPLVDAGRCDPEVAGFVADGYVAARRRRHPVTIDALHRLQDFITRMEKSGVHDEPAFRPEPTAWPVELSWERNSD